MTEARWIGIALLIWCVGLSAVWRYALPKDPHGGIRMIDFGEIYYGAQCVLQHKDPYNPGTVLREFQSEDGKLPAGSHAAKLASLVTTNIVNLPTALFLSVPFALLPWSVTQTLWTVLMAGFLALAAILLWDLGAGAVPAIWICMAGFILANSENLFFLGNVAGIAVSFSIIAAWCFLRQRYVLAGVLLMAIGLLFKPHDGGFIWLYFILAGGTLRKRALQTLLVTGVLGLAAVVWISQSSPHWPQELHRNLALELVRGGVDDPGPYGSSTRNVVPITDMEAILSVFWDNPRFYNPASYLIVGSLLLAGAIVVTRRRFSPEQAPFALAVISVLTLLPVYHRSYDAKLLLLTVPACAMLWSERGPRRWVALVLTSAGILATSDIPLSIFLAATRKLSPVSSTLGGKLMTLMLFRLAPLALVALGCFYLWVFIRYSPPTTDSPHQDDALKKAATATAAPLS